MWDTALPGHSAGFMGLGFFKVSKGYCGKQFWTWGEKKKYLVLSQKKLAKNI